MKPLTKKQIFDLQVKWNYPSEYRKLKNWWNNEKYWQNISWKEHLSEEFIREFQDFVDWKEISYYQNLSEDFIREFQDKVDWNRISWQQKLSEDFIREFQDRISWNHIFRNYKIQPSDFIEEMKHKKDT